MNTCQCPSCLTPAPQRDARDAYIARVHTVGDGAQPNFWTAEAQGKLAALENRPRASNPFRVPHVAAFDWLRGYDGVMAERGYDFNDLNNYPEAPGS